MTAREFNTPGSVCLTVKHTVRVRHYGPAVSKLRLVSNRGLPTPAADLSPNLSHYLITL
jgi:hypothetical protein